MGKSDQRHQRPASAESFTFPTVARLELDDLLEQLVERAQDVLATQGRLRSLLRATRAVGSDLELPTLLHRIAEEARVLVGARYAAVGVLGEDGSLSEFVHSGLDEATVAEIGHLPVGAGLLGHIITHPAPLRLRNLADHYAGVGFPPGHPTMGSFLAVPVRIRERVFGNLYLTEKIEGDEFTADDEELVGVLAAAAATAIDNARLFETVSRREHWIEASRSVTNALLDVNDRDEGLRLITRAVRATADADFAAVVVQDPSGELVVAAADGVAADDFVGRVLPWSSATATAVRARANLVVEDLSNRDEMHGPIKDLALGPLAVVPLSARDQVLGALAIGNKPGGRIFTSEDLHLAGDFAAQTALVLLVSAAQVAASELELSDERARIAQDLHDHAIQQIFAVGLALNSLAQRAQPRDEQPLVGLVEQLDDAIMAIRRSIFALQRPPEG